MTTKPLTDLQNYSCRTKTKKHKKTRFKQITDIKNKVDTEVYINYLEKVIKIFIETDKRIKELKIK
ncbi:MAG: hypothetical protein WC781_05730 [Candidatus Pacearchaeota archaeon]|jgi:hypothetical protein